uniref:Piezo type mechanosensitive ion channel component 1 (Er blood group) n=1 Tax=Crocodylus porosus TaxID=8502 RepID=A0A7M4EL53_CROPO
MRVHGQHRAPPANPLWPLSAACLFRVNALSLVYLLYLLLLPWFQGPTEMVCLLGHTGRLLRALLGTSILFLLAHLVFQICLYTVPGLSQLLGHNCEYGRGSPWLELGDIPNSVRLVAPDVGILLVSAICLGLCRRLRPLNGAGACVRRPASLEPLEQVTPQGNGPDPAGITLPSAFSSVYYLLFVGTCTWWACHFRLSHLGFNAICIMVGVYAAGHLLCLYSYQAPYVQAFLPPASIWARVFGLKDIVLATNCSSPNALVLNTSHRWPVYVNPGVLLLLYFTVATLLKLRRLEARHRVSGSWLALPFPSPSPAPSLPHCPRAPATSPDNCTVHILGDPSPLGKPWARKKRARRKDPLQALGYMVLKQSYVCALIAMMVWSITYHSWLTFVLLLWACLIWTMRSRHHFAMLCSPFLLLYSLTLCGLQYVWGMDLAPELPTRLGSMSLEQLGLAHTPYPCLDLGAKLLYTLTFWLLLRQSVKEKLLKRRCPPAPLLEVTVTDTEASGRPRVLRVLGGLVTAFYAKYWILVCAGMFIVVSFAGRLVVYKIVYMFLFLLCLTLFQVYYSLWRKLLKGFWWLVVAYTMLVLIAVYTYQFQDFPAYWRNLTSLTDGQLRDLGLEQFSVSALFSSILVPGFFLLACILQLHYFHRPFMRITDPEHTPAPAPCTRLAPRYTRRCCWVVGSRLLRDARGQEEEGGEAEADQGGSDTASEGDKWGLVLERLEVLGRGFSDVLTRGQVFVRRVLELHVLKLVALYTVWVALQEVSVMNFLLVALWAFALPYGRFRHMASCLSTVWTCIIIVCKMLYQLEVVQPSDYYSNCTQPLLNSTNLPAAELHNSTLYRGPVDPANWFGIRKGYPNLGYIQNHLLVLLLLVFEAAVYRRQEYYRRQHQLVPPATETIFEEGTHARLDQGLLPCAQYFLNYFYYKFGLEICFLMTVNVIGQRMNFMVILHGCWLVVILTRRRRTAVARLWPKYCLFLALFLLYQYLLCVGIPPALCKDYPWRWSRSIPLNSALIKWMYLPDFYMAPNSINLISDFLLLLCASQQWRVFEAERTEEWRRAAGENTDHLDPARDGHNPVPNFINCRSYLDMVKVVVFRYLFWFVLVVVFITGATRISIFGLGYLLACFYLLLFGTAMLSKPARARLAIWDCLILYNVTVIISKNMLSLLSCVFVQQMQNSFCWVIQLFSLVCTVKGYYDPKSMSRDQDCALPVEEAGIIWDSICFFFLLLQRRVFLSYYFLHVTADLQASALQASRGFALFKASMLKSMSFHRQAEKKSLVQLKRQGRPGVVAGGDGKHWGGRQGVGVPAAVPGVKLACVSPPCAVLHSGEYFLFESDSEEEESSTPEEQRPAQQSAFQLDGWRVGQGMSLPGVPRARAGTCSSCSQEHSVVWALPDGEGWCPSSRAQQSLPTLAEKSNVVQRVLSTLHFLGVLCQATGDGLTQWLRAITREHADMSTILWVERYVLTQKLTKVRDAGGAWGVPGTPAACAVLTLTLPATLCSSGDPLGKGAQPPSAPALPAGEDARSSSEEQSVAAGSQEDVQGSQELLAHPRSRMRTASELLSHRQFSFEELEESERFYGAQNRVLQLLLALYRFVAAHSDLLCYFIIILNNMVSASVISLFLPILVFLWAMLSIPRPSKRFWMTAIVYTEVMVVVKYLFQFGFFPWNSYSSLVRNEGKPYFPPRILGLDKTDRYIKYDLIQLMALFFHRSLLQVRALGRHLPKLPGTSGDDGAVELTVLGPEPELLEEGAGDGEPASQLRLRRKKKKKRKWGRKQKPRAGGLRQGHASAHPLPGRTQSVYQPVRRFFRDILHTQYRAATDVYALMFLADVVDFIIIIFGFWAFGKHSAAADITSSLSDDQVPEAFLVMLLIQFSTMVIDRALYLRKTVLGKLIFQVILVFGIHLWMFFILPAVTERMFSLNTVAQLWYFVKCIYFALSAYQIRCGYPTRILGNFLTKKYNHLNLFLFQGFRLVPFLVELRAVMDWVWTDTTLSLSNWMCVEDIYANIFIIKCSRETEKKYPQPKGQKKKKIVKYGMGGLIILFLICIIWFPLLFMSLVRSVVGVVNHPIDVTVTLKLGGYEPLFTMSAQQQSIQPFTPRDYEELTKHFERQPVAMQFITLYGYEDIVTARIEGSSGSLWSISPPSREQMRRELQNGSSDITLRFTWSFQRDLGKGGTVEHTFDKHTTDLQPGTPVRSELAQLLQGTRDAPVRVPRLFPQYIRAPNGPEANPVKQLLPDEEDSYLDVEVQLKRERVGTGAGGDGFLEWWVVRLQDCTRPADCSILPMVIFNDKVSPPSLGFLAGYGIMGLYVSIVLVIGKFVRGFFSEISHSIMFEELPCVDRILKLCQDIFLVRETGELALEEELYAKLIFLYRSPETMIKWTREKE